MNPRLRLAVLLLSAAILSCEKKVVDSNPAPPSTAFSNPLLASGPEPSVIKKGSSYYYTHTLGNRIAVWKTEKMSQLKNARVQTIWTAPATGPNSKNIRAPKLHYIGNKWYAYYSACSTTDVTTRRTFVLESTNDDPRIEAWVDRGKIFDPAADFFAMDGTVLNYNGSNYFIWCGQADALENTRNLYIARMSNPWTLATPRTLISTPVFVWEMAGSPPPVNEAPGILINPGGKIFLIYSGGGCASDDYSLGMLSLTDGSDPMISTNWTKTPSPVFIKNALGAVFGPGHNSFFKSADGTEDWILYDANQSSGQGCGESRSPRMQKLSWKADGFPNFGQPVSPGNSIANPSGE